MPEQIDILQELVRNTRSMKCYMAVLTFLVLLVAIMPVVDGVTASRLRRTRSHHGGCLIIG